MKKDEMKRYDYKGMRDVLMIYQNIDKLKQFNNRIRNKINSNDLESALCEMVKFNDTLISLVSAYEKINLESDLYDE